MGAVCLTHRGVAGSIISLRCCCVAASMRRCISASVHRCVAAGSLGMEEERVGTAEPDPLLISATVVPWSLLCRGRDGASACQRFGSSVRRAVVASMRQCVGASVCRRVVVTLLCCCRVVASMMRGRIVVASLLRCCVVAALHPCTLSQH